MMINLPFEIAFHELPETKRRKRTSLPNILIGPTNLGVAEGVTTRSCRISNWICIQKGREFLHHPGHQIADPSITPQRGRPRFQTTQDPFQLPSGYTTFV